MSEEKSSEYEDIISMPRHVSKKRKQMSEASRAAQFAPFAALNGFEGVLRERVRLTEEKIELDDEMKSRLDARLRMLGDGLCERGEVEITYFKPDKRKKGGSYVTSCGQVKEVDTFLRVVIMESGDVIPVDDIYSVEGEMFRFIDGSLI